jgi:maltose phosphorylase
MPEKAYEMYLRTGRLDLDNYNNDTEDGLHITSMAGTWLSIIKGFAGMRVRDGKLYLEPHLPKQWSGLTFHLFFREHILSVEMKPEQVEIRNVTGGSLSLFLGDTEIHLPSNGKHAASLSKTL